MRRRHAIPLLPLLTILPLLSLSLGCSDREPPDPPASTASIQAGGPSSTPAPPATAPAPPDPRLIATGLTPPSGTELLLVGLDGATFHVIDSLIADGALPTMKRLMQQGVRGNLRSERPIQSPPVWTTIATGKTRDQHGIHSFFITRDDGRKVPVTTDMRTARPFWGILSEVGISVGVIGWWPSWPAEPIANGFIISDRAWPVHFSPNAVPYGTRRTRSGQIAAWDFERRTWPDSLFEEFKPFILTEEMVMTPEITAEIFGRRADPEERMWNAFWVYAKDMTFARASIHFVGKYHPRVFAVYLEGTDVMAHYYWHDRPAERFEIDPAERALYGTAVDRYYRYADEVIRRLLEAAGSGASIMIVSDHGFETLWELKERWERGEIIEHEGGRGGYPYTHALQGIFIASGPGFAQGTRISGATIYDILPTLLERTGLPAGEDMPGKVLTDAFDPSFLARIPPRRITTWERPEDAARPTRSTPETPAGPMDDAILEKLKTLGYVD
jgi:arylsulfatase A-like enzyme